MMMPKIYLPSGPSLNTICWSATPPPFSRMEDHPINIYHFTFLDAFQPSISISKYPPRSDAHLILLIACKCRLSPESPGGRDVQTLLKMKSTEKSLVLSASLLTGSQESQKTFRC